MRERKKSWDLKVDLVYGSFSRARLDPLFASEFYRNLFFLKPKIKDYFVNTDFEHQDKALMAGLQYLFDFLDHTNQNARVQIVRISRTHSKHNLNIHPHDLVGSLDHDGQKPRSLLV